MYNIKILLFCWKLPSIPPRGWSRDPLWFCCSLLENGISKLAWNYVWGNWASLISPSKHHPQTVWGSREARLLWERPMSGTSGGGLFQQRTNATSHFQSPRVALGTHDVVVSTAYVTPHWPSTNLLVCPHHNEGWMNQARGHLLSMHGSSGAASCCFSLLGAGHLWKNTTHWTLF